MLPGRCKKDWAEFFARAPRVLATPPAAKKDGTTRVPGAEEIESGSLGARCVPAMPEDVDPRAEVLVSRGECRERRFDGAHTDRGKQAELGEQLRCVSVQEIRVHEDAHRRGPHLG
jgi:hypothetical protein